MTLLEKIKKEYVKQKYGFDYSHPFYEEKDLDEIAKRYAKAILERASENIAGESRQDEIQRIIENTKLD